MDYNIISRLKTAADKYECPSFIEGDPIRFPHRYGNERDIEVSAFISSWMAYGSRKVFLEVLERLHRGLGWWSVQVRSIRILAQSEK